ncbi:MAG: hypothetical protein WBQ65_20295, partial [Bryobacteraceae bacterium]
MEEIIHMGAGGHGPQGDQSTTRQVADRNQSTLGGHLKTGQSGSLQNRPVERIQDSYIFTSSVIGLASFFPSE